MTKKFQAPFTQNKNTGSVVCTAANTDYSDTPANTQLLWTASADGSNLKRVYALPRATVTATMLQLFRSTNGGVTKRLFATVLMPATTVGATAAIPTTDFGFDPTVPRDFKAGEQVYAATSVALAAGIVFHAEGEDYSV